MLIEKHGLRLSFDENTGEMQFGLLGESFAFTTEKSSAKIDRVQAIEDGVSYTASVEKITLSCTLRTVFDETGKYISLRLDSNGVVDGFIDYPAPFTVKRGDELIEAYGEGIRFKAEDSLPFPEERLLFGGCHNSMSFYSQASGEHWIMTAVIDNDCAYLMTDKNTEGLYRTYIRWEGRKGVWGNTREIRYYLGKGNAVVDCALQYRKVARAKGLVRAFDEKAKGIKNIEKLVGSAIVWLWNNDAMHKLYSPDPEYIPATKEQYAERRRVATEMKTMGMKDILWAIFDENIDKPTVEHIQSLGYLTAYYDVYTDVIPAHYAEFLTGTRKKRCENRVKYWPDGIIINKDGTRFPAWDLKGWDGKMYPQERMCDQVAIDCANEHVDSHGIANGIDGVFVDVSMGCTLECYHKDHPQTRKEGIEIKNKMLKQMHEKGLFVGAENPHEDAVPYCEYSEGLLSLGAYRYPDAGRRMATVYGEEEIPETTKKYMLNPAYRIPLWELVYHDCMSAYWYWGDSTNSAPSLINERGLFELLYGLSPLYSFSVETWDIFKKEIAKSYLATVPSAKKLYGKRMTDFCYLTEDRLVQKTTFSNAVQIIANFSNEPYRYNGKKIPPKSAKVIE